MSIHLKSLVFAIIGIFVFAMSFFMGQQSYLATRPPLVNVLELDCQLPCWQAIEINTTTREVLFQSLNHTYVNFEIIAEENREIFKWLDITPVYPPMIWAVRVTFQNHVATHIELYKPRLCLTTVINELGVPTTIWQRENPGSFLLYYADLNLNWELNNTGNYVDLIFKSNNLDIYIQNEDYKEASWSDFQSMIQTNCRDGFAQ